MAYLFVLLAGMIWGTTSVVAKGIYGMGQISPLALAFLRMFLAVPLLGMISLRIDRGHPWQRRGSDGLWWALAVLSMGLFQMCVFAALERTNVTTAIFLTICTAPVLVALVAPFALGEKLTGRTLAAGALALAGAALVLGIGTAQVASGQFIGNLLALAAAACWATYTIVTRRIAQHERPLRISFVTIAGAALVIAPVVFIQHDPISLPPIGWAWILYLAAVPTALAYFLYVRGLRRVTATTSAFLVLAEPATAALLAAILFDERLSATAWVGVGLLMAGLLLLTVSRRKG